MDYQSLLSRMNQGGIWNMIVIDGVVGVGKSTLMTLMEERGYHAFEEPVADNPLLDRFYHDRARYSFALQIFFLNRRFQHIKQAAKISNAVMDRSIYGDVIFAKMLYENNEMSREEFDLYMDLFGNMIEHCHPPKLMVYLEVSVDQAIRRIQNRGRDYEQIVEREYWEKLNQNYREYFAQYSHSPLLTINVDNMNFAENRDDQEQILNLIENKLSEIEANKKLAV
jgi:deoxyadenosine/deoxycytidine kinase